MQRNLRWTWLLVPIFLIASNQSMATQDQSTEEKVAEAIPVEAPYTVECDSEGKNCKVDKGTFIGWRTFHATCHVCHGQDAVGSTFAPSLVKRMKEIDKERFMSVVEDGFTGQVGVMPAWKQDPNVNKRFEQLYSYLMARADEVLATGRPDRIKKK